jgi:hypothetical protein
MVPMIQAFHWRSPLGCTVVACVAVVVVVVVVGVVVVALSSDIDWETVDNRKGAEERMDRHLVVTVAERSSRDAASVADIVAVVEVSWNEAFVAVVVAAACDVGHALDSVADHIRHCNAAPVDLYRAFVAVAAAALETPHSASE